jgi:hypothetical protein
VVPTGTLPERDGQRIPRKVLQHNHLQAHHPERRREQLARLAMIPRASECCTPPKGGVD